MLNVNKLFKKRHTNLGTKLRYTRYILTKFLITFKIITNFKFAPYNAKTNLQLSVIKTIQWILTITLINYKFL